MMKKQCYHVLLTTHSSGCWNNTRRIIMRVLNEFIYTTYTTFHELLWINNDFPWFPLPVSSMHGISTCRLLYGFLNRQTIGALGTAKKLDICQTSILFTIQLLISLTAHQWKLNKHTLQTRTKTQELMDCKTTVDQVVFCDFETSGKNNTP